MKYHALVFALAGADPGFFSREGSKCLMNVDKLKSEIEITAWQKIPFSVNKSLPLKSLPLSADTGKNALLLLLGIFSVPQEGIWVPGSAPAL